MIVIDVNPANPVEYLASLGTFAIASRLDPLIEARWPEEGGFELRSALSQAEIAGLIRPVLTEEDRWKFDREDATACRVQVDFSAFSLSLDWWYDYVNEVKDGRIFEKSSWKFFAGNQSVIGITRDLVELVAASLPAEASLTDFVRCRAKIKGRFGFDPLASKNALDAGYSPNNLGEPVLTSIAAELLSLFGIQVFFPPRCGALPRGWIEEKNNSGLAYGLWPEFLPLTLARVAAVRSRDLRLFSEKRSRDKYSTLSPARMI
jgi:CRISPR-associated protein Csb3